MPTGPAGPSGPRGPTRLVGAELHPATANVAMTASNSGRFIVCSNSIECLMVFLS
jgi:hypothetical protein